MSITKNNYIADYFINKDKLFAKTILPRDEYELYIKISDSLKITIPKPDLIIYLQTSPDILLERIKSRGNKFEKYIFRLGTSLPVSWRFFWRKRLELQSDYDDYWSIRRYWDDELPEPLRYQIIDFKSIQ